MIELRNVSAGYGGKPVLTDLSLTFPAGQITVLLGPNGCGKSTLLKAIVGLAQVSSGEILANGESCARLRQQELARAVAYLPQGRRVPDATVEQMVLHGRFPHLRYPRRYRREDYAIARAAMDRVGITELADQPMSRLSGGTRQKAYIAMALTQDTPTVLMDEPTTYLDIAHQLQLMALCRELADSGKAVVLVLHDLSLALEWADRVALLHRGRLEALGTVGEILSGGALERVFGVAIHAVQTPAGVRYIPVLPGECVLQNKATLRKGSEAD